MPESKKMVVKTDIHDEKCKRKALKALSGVSGIESFTMDMNDKKLTIIGDIDPVDVSRKLKKWNPEIVTVGPAKEDDKKDNKKDDQKEEEVGPKICVDYYRPYPSMPQQYYVGTVVEECPTAGCVIS